MINYKEKNKDVRILTGKVGSSTTKIISCINDIVMDKDCCISYADPASSTVTDYEVEDIDIASSAAILATHNSITDEGGVLIVMAPRPEPDREDNKKEFCSGHIILPSEFNVTIIIYANELINIIGQDRVYAIKINTPRQEGPIYR